MPRIIGELTRFGTVGAIAYVVDVAIFNIVLLTTVGQWLGTAEQPLAAKTLSVAIAVIVSWLGNRYWTYRHKRGRTKRGELSLFLLANLAGMAVSLGCLGISHYVLQFTSPLADNISANVIGLALGTAVRWWLYRTYVFTADGAAVPAPDSRQP